MKGTSKYKSRYTTVDGIKFHSMAESKRYQELKLLQKAGEIEKFELQPKFEIVSGYKDPATGKRVAPTYYIADFRVTYPDGRVVVEDVKGFITPIYRLKKKLVESQYGFSVVEVSA